MQFETLAAVVEEEDEDEEELIGVGLLQSTPLMSFTRFMLKGVSSSSFKWRRKERGIVVAVVVVIFQNRLFTYCFVQNKFNSK
eukprot:m.3636 g.3636  ORF g.3636 m.3636 type:complete len:83 (+) comp3677_c0_seq1:1583-1831(+)